MDLFVVNRYMNEDESILNKKIDEAKRLELLKVHIEEKKRKRKLALERKNVDEEETKSTNETLPDKKRKIPKENERRSKRNKVLLKINDEEDSNKIASNLDKELCEQPVTKKKKKIRKDEINAPSNNSIEENEIEIKPAEKEFEKTESIENSTKSTSNSKNSKTELGFTVIGKKRDNKEVKKLEKTLPDWLAKPHIVDTDLSCNLLPVDELDVLSKSIQSRLHKLKIKSLFPIQRVVIPTILNQVQKGSLFGVGGYRPSDVCVSAPTGSGKTLSYVIPIVQALSSQTVRLLQALVLLPTKDLAFQVKQVFQAITKGTGLKVGLISGKKALAKEQKGLINQGYGSISWVNILVATPGRLVEHLSQTRHFTLQHLRFLVIDEADRLLDHSHYDLLNKILLASYIGYPNIKDPIGSLFDGNSIPTFSLQTTRVLQSPLTPERLSRLQLPFQKLLFSATMTHSPEKLAPLQLNDPVLFVSSKPPEIQKGSDGVQGTLSRYSVPHGLTEYMTVCNAGDKPLVLIYLITQKKLSGVLCFTSSLEATHRLFLLVKLFGGVEVAEYSSNLNAQQRHGILRDFRKGSIQLLICSDAMARGMDIDNVSYVISYDAPKFVKTYIHRVGRTARAGNEGTAYTLLHSEQVYYFKELIQKTGREKIPRQTIKDEELQPLVQQYQNALEKLEDTVKNENQEPGHKVRGHGEAEKYLKQQLMENIEK